MADFNLPTFEQLLAARKGLGSGATAQAALSGAEKGFTLAEQVNKHKIEQEQAEQDLAFRKAEFMRKVAELQKGDRPYYTWVGARYNPKTSQVEEAMLEGRSGRMLFQSELPANQPIQTVPNAGQPVSPASPYGQGQASPKSIAEQIFSVPGTIPPTTPQIPSTQSTGGEGRVLPKTAHTSGTVLSQQIQKGGVENIIGEIERIVPKMPKTGFGTARQLAQNLAQGWAGGDPEVIQYEQATDTYGRALYKYISKDVGNIAEHEGQYANRLLPRTFNSPAVRVAKLKTLRRLKQESDAVLVQANKLFQTGQLTDETFPQYVHDNIISLMVTAGSTLPPEEEQSTPTHNTLQDKKKSLLEGEQSVNKTKTRYMQLLKENPTWDKVDIYKQLQKEGY